MSDNVLKTKAKHPTEALFGVDPDGNPVKFTLAKGPHWLICGQTGSGKSVFVNAMLVSMMYHALPSELQIAWIDPKKVEAAAYVGLPYSIVDPITDMDNANAFLLYMTHVMDFDRYEILERLKLKNIGEYNEWVDENPEEAKRLGLERWPFIIVVIDEYADLVAVHPQVENAVVRLGQKARAAGIHVMLATQRPSADVVTGLIKANVPARVGLLTADANNSRIILDTEGCETLRGYGDALVKSDTGEITRCQGPFITNGEIDAIFAKLRETYGANDPVDYKTKTVELGICEWAEEYDDSTPVSNRIVKEKRKSRY